MCNTARLVGRDKMLLLKQQDLRFEMFLVARRLDHELYGQELKRDIGKYRYIDYSTKL